jgi:stage II sporulation protein D (peptidoglycan lytic transglycosylase)
VLFRVGALLQLLFLAAPLARAQEVKIGVLGLFHPHEITLASAAEDGLVIVAADKTFLMEPGSRSAMASIRISGSQLVFSYRGKIVRTTEVRAFGRNHASTTLILGISEKITRRYQGTLVVKSGEGVVLPVITMDLETAVASVVAAEAMPGTELEALKAQAVVTRSYFFAGAGRHHEFDFCDLTHCQFLREPPAPGSNVATASQATRGLVLRYEGKPIATMFTRSCGGRTRTPAELNISEGTYPYFSVVCAYCNRNPTRWTRTISKFDASILVEKGEGGRLAVDRRIGWNAIPSNTFTSREVSGEVVLEGVGQGHGIGLCQRGSSAMANGGSNFREILQHYFPNTTLGTIEIPQDR